MILSKRTTVVAIAAAIALPALSGCSLLNLEVPRDESGQVLEPTVIGSTQLLVDDCFSFVDEVDLSEAEVTPCTNDHTHIVIAKGELTKAEIGEAGGLQNAISSACSERFSAFKETASDGVRPDQEFIISTRESDTGVLLTDYACIATDAPLPGA